MNFILKSPQPHSIFIICDDAVVMDTVGTSDIIDVMSDFSNEEKNTIVQNIRDEDIKEFVQASFDTRLSEIKEKYKWYRNNILRKKRIERRLAVKDFFQK